MSPAEIGKGSHDGILYTLSIPKPDDETLDASMYPSVRDFFLLVNKRFTEIYSDPGRPEGPYLMARNVELEVYKHFIRLHSELWAKFKRGDGSGDVWYYGDPSFVHEAVIFETMEYLRHQIQSALNDVPLGPPDFEAAVDEELRASPMLSRGQCVYRILFCHMGSLGLTISEEWKAKRSRQPQRDESRQGGHKEADALIVCECNTNIAVLALEVAYQNESLAETAEEVLMWGKQQDLLAIGLKIDSRSPLHKLDPKAVLFISRKPEPGHPATTNADGLVSAQYPVGRGSGISVDRRNILRTRRHVELENDPEHGHLLAEIDWDGSAAQTPKQWYSPADGYDLIQEESMVSLPLGHQLEPAVGVLLCGLSAVTSSAAYGQQRVDSTPIGFSAFMDTFSITIDFSHIRRIILKAILDGWMRNNLPRSTLAEERYVAGLQARKTGYKMDRTAERDAEENSKRGGAAEEAGPSRSKSRKVSREESIPAAEEGDREDWPETSATSAASSSAFGGRGRKAAKNSHQKARRFNKANKKLNINRLSPANPE